MLRKSDAAKLRVTAAVRFEDGRTGVVDDSGTPLMVTDRCRRLRFLKGELLSVTKEDGSDCYTDLKTNRTYQERPVVFHTAA